jgi:hypothetical protein
MHRNAIRPMGSSPTIRPMSLIFPRFGLLPVGQALGLRRGAPPGFSTSLQDLKSAAGSRAQTERLPHQN